MRYSNEFYFVTPATLVTTMEVPAECGLIEAGSATVAEWKQLIDRHAGFFSYDPDTRSYCMITIPAPYAILPDRLGSWSPRCCATNGGSSPRSRLSGHFRNG